MRKPFFSQLQSQIMAPLFQEDDSEDENESSRTPTAAPYQLYLTQAPMPASLLPDAGKKAFMPMDAEISRKNSPDLDGAFENVLGAYLDKLEEMILVKGEVVEALKELDKVALIDSTHPRFRHLKKLLADKIEYELTKKQSAPEVIQEQPISEKNVVKTEKVETVDQIQSAKEKALEEAERMVLNTHRQLRKSVEKSPYLRMVTEENQSALSNREEKTAMNASSISSKENEKPSYLMAPKNREYAVRLDLADPNVSEQEPEKITLRSDFSDDIATTGSEKPDFKEDTAVFSRTPFDFSQEVLREDEMSSALRREAENLEGQNTAKQFQEQTAAPEEKIFYEERVEENPEAIEQQPTWGAVMPRAVEDFILRGKKFLRQKKYSLALISFSKAKQKDLEEKYQQEVEFLIEMTKEKLAEISER